MAVTHQYQNEWNEIAFTQKKKKESQSNASTKIEKLEVGKNLIATVNSLQQKKTNRKAERKRKKNRRLE